jgi:hypothetical protein
MLGCIAQRNPALRNSTSADAPEQPVLDLPSQPEVIARGVPNGGSRATAVTSDRHAARLALRSVSDLIE